MPASESRTARLRALALAGESEAAAAGIAALLADLFDLAAEDVRLNHDQYSLNSLNGFFRAGGAEFFFKFHQEEGEEAVAGEYYRAGILAAAGLPLDMPVHISREPGAQILVYRRRTEPRFADVLRALEERDDEGARSAALAAETALNAQLLEVCRRTLHPITPMQSAAEPIHQLFYKRLVDDGQFPGGRYRRFYLGQDVALPGLTLPWSEFSALRFVINGAAYQDDLATLFARAEARLRPQRLADAGGVVAHGDAHNANLWYGAAGLSLFDPAFAGEHVPALLAEVKSTFHNIFAHPFWLYDPDLAAARFSATARVENGALHIETDWALTPVRQELLLVKAESFWRPWLAALRHCGMLPTDWREVLRLALFLCPTLVMNLRSGAGRHNPVSSAIGFAMAVMAGSEPAGASAPNDMVTPFLALISRSH